MGMLGCAWVCSDVRGCSSVCVCRWVCADVWGYGRVCVGFHRCQMCSDLHRYARVCMGVLRCARMFIGMCGCAQVCVGVHFNTYPILSYTNFFWNILSTLCISFRAGWFSYLGRFCREFDKRDEFRNRSIGLIVGLLRKVCVGNVES